MICSPFVIAHRGDSANCPENTLPAFQQAIEAGADVIEFDVVTTLDNVVVVSHDTQVDRCTDGTGAIRAMTLEQIKRLDAGMRIEGFTGTRIPTLEETLDFFDGQPVRLCIEIKGDTPAAFIATAWETVDILRSQDCLQRVVITSFNADCLRAIKSWEQQLATGLDPARQDGSCTAWQLCGQVLDCRANFLVHRHETLTQAIVDEAHLHGFSVWTWTVDSPEDMYRVIQMNVDAIMTNHPEVLRQYLDHTGTADIQL